MIGRLYKYPNSNKQFRLKNIFDFVYEFECGHRVTDNVFIDLVEVK